MNNLAKVNGRFVSQRQFDDMALLYKQQTKTQEINEAERRVIFDQIIDNFLLLEEANKRKINVDDEFVNQNISAIKKEFGNDETFNKELEKYNISFDEFKNNIKETLIIQKFTEEESKRNVKITVDMLENYYEEHKESLIAPEMVRARHILIGKKQAGSMEKAVEKAEELLKEINNGADFAETAKKNSDCPSSEKGGDLGIFGRKQMVPEFDELAFSLKVGDIGGPVKTTFGAHLIRVDEKLAERNISYKEAQPYIEKIIYQRESQKIMKAIADELRKTAEIEIF